MSVPGTDLRSIPNDTPIGALADMSAVEATGGESSNIGSSDLITPELAAVVQSIGPDVALTVLTAVASNPELLQIIQGGPAPAPVEGPDGAMTGMM